MNLLMNSPLAQAHVLATTHACGANEIVPMLVLAAGASCACTDVTAATAPSTALELFASAVHAHDGTLLPSSALGVLRHRVGNAAGLAALAARRLARVPTALVPASTREAVLAAVAADITRGHAYVTTARAASATLECVAMGVDTCDRVAGAGIALGDGVLVTRLPFVTALASWSSTRVPAATSTFLAREEVPIGVLAAQVALRLADVTATLTVTAREWVTLAIDARLHVPELQVLREVPLLCPH